MYSVSGLKSRRGRGYAGPREKQVQREPSHHKTASPRPGSGTLNLLNPLVKEDRELYGRWSAWKKRVAVHPPRILPETQTIGPKRRHQASTIYSSAGPTEKSIAASSLPRNLVGYRHQLVLQRG